MVKNICIRQQADLQQIDRCKSEIEDKEVVFEKLSSALSLAGNPVRLKILFLLLCVCDMSDILKMNVSAISQHLRKLKDRNLIVKEREAQTIFYSLAIDYKALLQPFFTILDKNQFHSIEKNILA